VLTGWSSKIDFHVIPRLVDFQTPLVAPTTYTVAASFGCASTSCNRPPWTAGPIDLNGMLSKGDPPCALADCGRNAARSNAARSVDGRIVRM
jgi:hypothetical protein